MSYLRTELPHNPDFPAVAEALRKLIKRTDELERESKNAQQKISQYEKDIVKLSNRCDNFGNKIQQLESKNLMLENRCKAVDDNALARLKNSRVANPDHVLTPLKEAATNLPIKNFPKHEKDIRVMSPTEVKSTLQSLDQPTTGSASEQKLRLREAVGRDLSTPTKSLGDPSSTPSANNPSPSPDTQTPKPTDGAKKAAPKRPSPAPRAMSVQDKKLAGIRAAKEKLAMNRQYGGAADPRVRKGSVVPSVPEGVADSKGEGKAEGAGKGKGEVKGEGKGEGKVGVKKEIGKEKVGKKVDINGVA